MLLCESGVSTASVGDPSFAAPDQPRGNGRCRKRVLLPPSSADDDADGLLLYRFVVRKDEFRAIVVEITVDVLCAFDQDPLQGRVAIDEGAVICPVPTVPVNGASILTRARSTSEPAGMAQSNTMPTVGTLTASS